MNYLRDQPGWDKHIVEFISLLADFTERIDQILKITKEKVLLENLFSYNSIHLVDLAFHLCGYPEKISSYSAGFSDWHKKPMLFSGSGVSNNNSLFTYNTNWDSAGRWNLEICTKINKYILRPIEIVQVMEKGSMEIKTIDSLDLDNMTKSERLKLIQLTLPYVITKPQIEETPKEPQTYQIEIIGGSGEK